MKSKSNTNESKVENEKKQQIGSLIVKKSNDGMVEKRASPPMVSKGDSNLANNDLNIKQRAK